ncbi:glycosyltransferase family 4 protein [Acidomonas methanolica]|uniref:Glycosyl transferase n=2 Tax=Acidomonas methanolica TaxID=437 RepID=A0A023D0K4_ACIMT|nr:glycosyltransferase family 4 protein [Acidomonas methanolica]MBU2653333.1 glycosyltransferase family 4 protein [Acidomonas methanolica]TCS32284.1 glycosyltransferase involved in cell wall biosynthesis [Acidomonas methanolica]GAJ27657.1 glycosyl transferase [Acidomonas methanolica NBRC 104435]GEK97719.1 glycosyl transferase [Acidomonas methanolica NBRC 104435]
MKILEITNVDFALRQFLLPLMRALRDAGHEVTGACAEGADLAPARAEGFAIHAVPLVRSMAPGPQFRAFLALRRLIRQERPDLVHAHMPISGLLARFAAWSAGVPVIAYTCHGFLYNQPGPRGRRWLALVLEVLAGKITDLYMTVSTEEAADARRLRINRQARPIGNGRDVTRFRPDAAARSRIRAALGVPAERVVVIAVSRQVRHKGYPELLRAMEAVPDAEIWIVGERLDSDHGESLDPFFARAEERLGERMRRLGRRDDVAALLAAADIFVLPSHFEGLPMSVIEAMLCGLPIVTTDIRGPREQVEDGRQGILVPPGLAAPLSRALNRLVGDPALRRRMGEAARERALALYDETRVIARTVALIEAAWRRKAGGSL